MLIKYIIDLLFHNLQLMLSRLEAARVSEEQADELLNSQEEKHAASIEKKDVETAAEDLEETLMKSNK